MEKNKQLELPLEDRKSPLEMREEYQRTSKQDLDADLYNRLIHEEYDEWIDESKPEAELKELSDLVYVIYGYAYAKGWDLDEALKRVHDNNMGRMYQPDGSILRRDDGKVIKNKDYPKVNLSDLVEGE